jgi:IclR family transcriptional regulator, pca regulon regulatory protein
VENADSSKGRYHISALAKGLACLQAFASKVDGFSLSQLSRHLNVNPATASRICGTLIDLGFLQRDDQKKYYLTPRVLTLGYSYLSSLPNSPYIQHSLVELFGRVGEPVSLGVLVGQDVVYLLRIPKDNLLPFDVRPGASLPAYCTALGKAILAFSPQDLVDTFVRSASFLPRANKTITSADAFLAELNAIRSLGFACNDEELYPGSRAVAAPVFDRYGCAVAAISLPLPASRYSLDHIKEILAPQAVKTARDISFLLQTADDPFHLGVRSGRIVRSE